MNETVWLQQSRKESSLLRLLFWNQCLFDNLTSFQIIMLNPLQSWDMTTCLDDAKMEMIQQYVYYIIL